MVDLLGRYGHRDVRVHTIERLKAQYRIDEAQAERVARSVNKLYGQVAKEWGIEDPRFVSYLGWAAQVHEIGLAISHSQYHKHGAYLLQYSDMLGFSHREQQILSLLVRAQRRKFPTGSLKEIALSYAKSVKKLAVLFRLAVLLNRSRQNREHPECTLRFEKNEISLWFSPGWLSDNKMVEGDLGLEKTFLGAAGIKFSYQ